MVLPGQVSKKAFGQQRLLWHAVAKTFQEVPTPSNFKESQFSAAALRDEISIPFAPASAY